MYTQIDVTVPNIGIMQSALVIDTHIKAGDILQTDELLVTLEADKASFDIPSPFSGLVREVKLKPGDKVAEGSIIAVLQVDDANATAKANSPSRSFE